MKIYTGSYENCRTPKSVSIYQKSIYGYQTLKGLSPSKNLREKWAENSIKKDDEKAIASAVASYYRTTLKKNDPGIVLNQLQEGSILASPEAPNEFSPRHIVAAWLELFYNLEIREIKALKDGKIQMLPRNSYYKTIKDQLEALIKGDIDMGEHSSIAVAHAYQRAQHLKEDPSLEKRIGITSEMLFRIAEVLEIQLESKDKTF